MMYPRLRLLRELLSDEGFIAVSINDVETSNLGLLLDEIFGTGNRLCMRSLALREERRQREDGAQNGT